MMTSVYISDENMVAACGSDSGGKLHISSAYRIELPESLISNGQISDTAALSKCVEALFSKRSLSKNVRLVLSSNLGVSQIMDVPSLNPPKLRSLIANELSSQNTLSGDSIYDYSLIKGASGGEPNRILACGVEKELIGKYMKAFSDARTPLSGINAGVSCAVALRQRLTEKVSGTFAISMINGHDMTSFLFSNGIYSVSLRNKLSEKRGTQSLAVEVSRNLSALIQFNTSQAGSAPIGKIFLSGMRDDEANYRGDIAAYLETDIGMLFDSVAIKYPPDCQAITQYGDFLYCCGDIIQG